MGDVLSITEAANELGLQAATLRTQIRFGKITANKIGPIWTMSRAEVDRYRAEHLGRPGVRSTAKSAR